MTDVQLSYPNAECPDCGKPIGEDVWPGDICPNCEHVFWVSDDVLTTTEE